MILTSTYTACSVRISVFGYSSFPVKVTEIKINNETYGFLNLKTTLQIKGCFLLLGSLKQNETRCERSNT